MFIGDLNYDMLVSDKSSPLQNVCDIFDLTNLVNKVLMIEFLKFE
jgi:hypothetical protein